MYNYTLIISQYYHSKHYFIVEFPKDFKTTFKNFIRELEEYKRSSTTKDIRYGDVESINPDYISSRYNVNDEGDIYFINFTEINPIISIIQDYTLDSYKRSRGYIRNQIIQDINNHHSYDQVLSIVKKHFKLI